MPHRNLFRKILFCTDFNTDAMKAFHYALNVASGNEDSEIIIFHAIPEPDAQFWKTYIYEVDENIDSKAKTDIDKKIRDIYLPSIPQGVSYSSHFAIGNVGKEILKYSEDNNIDLIVIGRGSGSNFVNKLLGNFTKKIAEKSKCPVLIVPDDE